VKATRRAPPALTTVALAQRSPYKKKKQKEKRKKKPRVGLHENT